METTKMDFTVLKTSTFVAESVESLLKKLLWIENDEDFSINDIREDFPNGLFDYFDGTITVCSLYKNCKELTRSETLENGTSNWADLINNNATEFEVKKSVCRDNNTEEIVRDFTLYEFTIHNNEFKFIDWDL